MLRRQNALVWGVFHGVMAWMAYGVAEFILATLLPMTSQSGSFRSWLWPQIGLLAGGYLLAGVASGGIAGMLAALAAERFGWTSEEAVPGLWETAATLTLALACAGNLAMDLGEWPGRIGLTASLALAYGLIWSRTSAQRVARWRFLANPWFASLLLLAAPWYSFRWMDHSLRIRLGLPVFVAGAFWFLLSARGAQWLRAVWPPAGRGLIFRRAAVLAGILLLVCAGIATRNRNLEMALHAAHLQKRAGDGPNVVLVTVDTVRADHLSLYGHARDTTPQLREFARSATLYQHAIATAENTLPTHASIFTGTYPREHGAHPGPFGRKEDELSGLPIIRRFHTLAECLAAKGYATATVAANNFYLRQEFGLARGFQLFYVPESAGMFVEARTFLLREGMRKAMGLLFSTAEFDRQMLRADEINRDAFAVLDRLKQGGAPFFLFLNYMDAHFPYLPPPPFDTRFPGKDPAFLVSQHDRMLDEVMRQQTRDLTQRERQHLESQYDGAIAYIDVHIGKLIARLKELGLYDHTILLITADHGEELGEHRLIGHSKSVYQNEVKVPLLVKYPGQTQGSVVEEPVSQVDLMPTILAAVGCPIPPQVRGRNLRDPVGHAPRQIFSMSYYSPWRIPRFNRIETTIFFGEMKLITSTMGTRELYDLSRDPGERNNLYRPDDPVAQDLRAKMDAWMRDTPQPSGADTMLDEREMQRLRSLGYVQ